MNMSALGGVVQDRPMLKLQEQMQFESEMQSKLISRLQSGKNALMCEIERIECLLVVADSA